MLWKGRRGSANVEDRRGMRVSGGMGVAGLGLGGLLIVALYLMLGGDPSVLSGAGIGSGAPVRAGEVDPGQEELAQMTSVVLADTEDVWNELFASMGKRYEAPTMVLFSDYAESACGMASAAVGPFYCPGDEQLYIDLSFLQDLESSLGAPGDLAQAYVIAHEVGHHVQKLLGTLDQVNRRREASGETEANELSVRLELQADFLAGVFVHHAQENWKILEAGDIEEALNAASRIGDDRLQKRSQGYVVPESFTHGTSEQRARWLRRGIETGDPRQGDTFGARDL
jgi:predicted metalloprotease